MVDFFAGWLLVLAGGLIGAELLLARQSSLKDTLQHLQIYQDSIGLFNVILGGGSLFHALSSATTHSYAPLYWLLYFGSALCAFCVGVTLCVHFLNARLAHGPEWVHRAIIHLSLWTRAKEAPFTWLSLSLGLWRALDPILGV